MTDRTTQHVHDRDPPVESPAPPTRKPATDLVADSTTFLSDAVADAGAEGVVVNLSGGIDSAVAATLAVEALGPGNVSGLILPAATNADENIEDAQQLACDLGIDYRTVDIQPIIEAVQTATTRAVDIESGLPLAGDDRSRRGTSPVRPRHRYRAALGNAAARIRMLLAYFEANTTSRLVLGTGNRTELLLGYFTKYGDGGVDLLPLGDYYKTEVRELARALDVPEHIIEKPPTAGLWAGQTDEGELGAPYETIDAILHSLVDQARSVEETAATLAVDVALVDEFEAMVATAVHKRTPPPTPATYPRDAE